jgi:Fe-S cluster biogenesis protein NfuA
METSAVYVSLEFTPNPNTLKYSVNRKLIEKGAANFTSLEATREKSPLAEKLMSVDGISAVMIGRDFVTITKSEAGDWDHVHKSASSTIESHLTAGGAVLIGDALNRAEAVGGSDVEKRIQAILDSDIRPAVAQDGGDVTMDRYEDGIVYLFMQGACAGCPSSAMTLKMGIETKLKEAIPEIIEVVSV